MTVTPPGKQSTAKTLSYDDVVYKSLVEMGIATPETAIASAGDYIKKCRELGIAPQVTAALVYSAERHRHEVSRTTIHETIGLQSAEGDPSAMAPVEEAPKTAYRYADISFARIDDAQKFAGLLEKSAPNIGTFVAGTSHGANVTTNASPEVISKVLRKHRWKGAWKMSEAAKMAAEEMPRGPGGVQSQIAVKTECTTCIPWQKVARDPQQHAEIGALAKKFGPIKTPRDVYSVVGADLQRETQEVFLVLALNIHGELMAPAYEVARGQRDRVTVGIDNVLDAASDARCAAFVVAHQHPGDSPKPSEADMKLTRDIRAATPPGRTFVDHVVIGIKSVYSCTERKLYKIK